MAPQQDTLPYSFRLLMIMAESSPPILSKKQSTPFGAPSASASLTETYVKYGKISK